MIVLADMTVAKPSAPVSCLKSAQLGSAPRYSPWFYSDQLVHPRLVSPSTRCMGEKDKLPLELTLTPLQRRLPIVPLAFGTTASQMLCGLWVQHAYSCSSWLSKGKCCKLSTTKLLAWITNRTTHDGSISGNCPIANPPYMLRSPQLSSLRYLDTPWTIWSYLVTLNLEAWCITVESKTSKTELFRRYRQNFAAPVERNDLFILHGRYKCISCSVLTLGESAFGREWLNSSLVRGPIYSRKFTSSPYQRM